MEDGGKTSQQVVRVGIAVVLYEQSVLVGIRATDVELPGLHEFPGGKCRSDESAAECAIRECREETGLDVDIVELLNHTQHVYDHGVIDLSFFLCHPISSVASLTEPFHWIPLHAVHDCTFPEGNHEVLAILKDRVDHALRRENLG